MKRWEFITATVATAIGLTLGKRTLAKDGLSGDSREEQRSLNPPRVRYYFTNFNNQPKNNIFLDLVSAKLAFVVTKRRHEFSKNSDILSLMRQKDLI